ncbi:hypothetical protein AW119_27820 [Escherichia coli]|uniref:DUF1187 family protein n=1 Tax=Escherichia coli TaxID=562 RepID=UPI0005CCAD12|nr:DUF1187 family protein [Escherichia coli]EFK1743236.1 DUF1187 family protein [Escherichia coli]EID2634038.1 DUF1187 family protein [Escherichia coli]KAE9771417.1 DUF1187 family protein [Escherichia coli]MZQ06995.1 DUF1187 family protein [Escherichia coli]OTD29080.1 hypothetical protein AW095_26820 [Escherichia coli]
MVVRYKITATIIRPGGLPVQWIRYSDRKMTVTECEKMFSPPKEPGRSFGDRARVKDFCCNAIADREEQ